MLHLKELGSDAYWYSTCISQLWPFLLCCPAEIFFFMPPLISVIMVGFSTAGRNVVHSERPLLTFYFASPNLSKISLHCYYAVWSAGMPT